MTALKNSTTKTEDKELTILEKHEISTDWREKALWYRDNHKWLMYSRFIALKTLKRLDELNLSQKQLARMLDCSPQYISRLLKGTENLTLKTISKIEECLDLDLISSALSFVRGYDMDKDSGYHRVAEPIPSEYGHE
ncbi:MAG: helix-turn-helix transcriptional regulator [Bacteroidales bacterium]|nr:helix-turn-helix transcriptional regulator [Bacteroidales bacterium]